ncbi:YbaN family protein [Ponticaulis sp.]|uniref:YbaN family protein n=1 Tax=Ponticaulis sp. TaxID=2020902 RepID=UPI000B7349BE|nr:YbaN family protein [Ponticaulis sp.]MAI91674.1 hypothetical protein [Ponticaulis sp.]OUX96938.1 MAG: hypothetical protein CBB65_14630 [Hyphomonadaceae bacterium TMED5]|tara:strand:+ start:990 stop:1424 length:435 start_codon:yes stop_codon:yes gene_type:complete
MIGKTVIRGFWLVCGLLFTGLAFIGVALPLVPTTPFLLLAAFCFARSSKRFSDWLHNHALFGRLITDWNRHGAISRRAKYTAGACLIAAPVLSFLVGAPLWTIGVQIPILAGSGFFIFTRPDPPRERVPESDEEAAGVSDSSDT